MKSLPNYSLHALLLFFACTPLRAFPPAPTYTLFGTVRDQVGQTLDVDGAEIVLLEGTAELGRTTIARSGVQLDQNYQLNIRLDALRAGTQTYVPAAVPAQGQFSLAVEIGGQRYYPIEASAPLTAGKGAERVRLNLTLGQDTDHDGLPDVWEQWQLFQAGFLPGANGWDLTKITRDGDLDGDGQSNWLEYLAGTFAGDRTQTFALTIKEKVAGAARFEFFTIPGKLYTLERTLDLQTWSRVAFTAAPAGEAVAEAAETYRGTSVGVVAASCAALPGQPREMYRLTVR